MKLRLNKITYLLAAGALTLSACGTQSAHRSSSEEYEKDGNFVTVVNADPGNLNPLVSNLNTTQIVNAYTYDSLLSPDVRTGELRPYLAKSWTEIGNQLRFSLREHITCTDGSAFTARTAADAINWVTDKTNGSPLLGSTVPASTVATVENDELVITTAEPAPFLLARIGVMQLPCAAAIADPSSIRASSNGTGLFKVTEVVPNDHITMERRDGYTWSPDTDTTSETLGVPKTVTIKIITDPTTAANLVLTGSANAATVPGADEDRVRAYGLDSSPYTRMSGEMIFNQHDGLPTADRDVRTALVQAVDLDSYSAINTGGVGTRAGALAVAEPLACNYRSVEGAVPTFDSAAAARKLAALGWKRDKDENTLSKDGKTLSLNVVFDNSRDTSAAAAEYLASQWEKLGVKVTLRGGNYNYIISNTYGATDPTSWDVSMGLSFQSNIPSMFHKYFSGPTKPEGINFASITNENFSNLADNAATLPGSESCPIWEKAERELISSADVIPVSTTPTPVFFNGATSLEPPSSGIIPGFAIRVLS